MSISSIDVEKGGAPSHQVVPAAVEPKLLGSRLWRHLSAVEVSGVEPVPLEARTDRRTVNIFTVWWTMSLNILPIVTGMLGPLVYELSLRDSSLIIIFFVLITSIPPAYCSTIGPQTGLRQMISSRYCFGLYLNSIPVILNLATITGFGVIDSVVGGTALSAVSGYSLTVNAGIIIMGVLGLVMAFFGTKVLHQYERYAWIPVLVAIIIATGVGGKSLKNQSTFEPATASAVLSFAGLIAGYMLPWSSMASDFGTYIAPGASKRRLFLYCYLGLALPSLPLMILGAAIGGAVPNTPALLEGYNNGSVGGALGAMLQPAGGFGKFILVIISFSTLGNLVAAIYSVSLNFQTVFTFMRRLPRAIYAIVTVAVIIPVAIEAAKSFFSALESFIGVIAYWAAAYAIIVVVEHSHFRGNSAATYDIAIWEDGKALPTGIPAIAAGALAFAIIIPSMSQVWYTGPIAKYTGDIGFEMALTVTGLLYPVFRTIEIRVRGRL